MGFFYKISCSMIVNRWHNHTRFTALFPGPPGWAGARKLLDFMVQGKINRGRHTLHPAGHHSIWTNLCPPPSPPFFYRPDALPAAKPTVSKHWRQQKTLCPFIYLNFIQLLHSQCSVRLHSFSTIFRCWLGGRKGIRTFKKHGGMMEVGTA